MTDTTPATAYAAALAAFQAEIPHVGKGQTASVKSDKGSYSYDYADLTTITEAAFPLLTKHGLAFSAKPTLHDGAFVLDYELMHESGHREGGCYPLPDPARSSPQQIGSAITYGRRYCLCAVTGIAPGGEDDDGQRAADARSVERRPARQDSGRAAAPTPTDLRGQAKALGERLGWDTDTIAADYAEKHGGEHIGSASVESLAAYVAVLRQQVEAIPA